MGLTYWEPFILLYVDIEIKPKIIYDNNEKYNMSLSIPLEKGKTGSFKWHEKKRKGSPIYYLDCEIQ
jgi:hypothetical protein